MSLASRVLGLAVTIPHGLGRQLQEITAATKQPVKQTRAFRFYQLRLPAIHSSDFWKCPRLGWRFCSDLTWKLNPAVLEPSAKRLQKVCAGARNSSNAFLLLDFLYRLFSSQFILLTVCHCPITEPLSGCHHLQQARKFQKCICKAFFSSFQTVCVLFSVAMTGG